MQGIIPNNGILFTFDPAFLTKPLSFDKTLPFNTTRPFVILLSVFQNNSQPSLLLEPSLALLFRINQRLS